MRWLGYLGGLALGVIVGWACGGASGDCTIGSSNCDCTAGGACDPGLTCVNGTCVMIDCPVGREGCPCTGGGACDPGLTCVDDICEGDGSTDGPTPPGTTGNDDNDSLDDDSSGPGSDVLQPCNQLGCSQVDLLFALDSSLSMTEEIQALTASQAFNAIITNLENLNCGVEYRVGVTNDNDGGFIGFGANGNPWFDSLEMTPEEIQAAFSTAAGSVLGSGGTAIGCEHVLSSARSTLALDTTGFIREDALLVLVLVTDVDDYGFYDQQGFGGPCDGFLCTETAQPVQQIYDQLVTLKAGDPAGLAAIVVAGDPNMMEGLNTCQQPATCCGVGLGECAGAHHAPRLWEFAGLMTGSNGYTGNICDGAAQIPLLIQDALENNIDLACQTYEPEG